MIEMVWSLSLLVRIAGIDIVFGKSIDTRDPVISSNEFYGSGDAKMVRKWGIMMILEDFCHGGLWHGLRRLKSRWI